MKNNKRHLLQSKTRNNWHLSIIIQGVPEVFYGVTFPSKELYSFLSICLTSFVFGKLRNNMYRCKFILSPLCLEFLQLEEWWTNLWFDRNIENLSSFVTMQSTYEKWNTFRWYFFDSENELKDSFLVSLTFLKAQFPASGLQHSSLCLQTFG